MPIKQKNHSPAQSAEVSMKSVKLEISDESYIYVNHFKKSSSNIPFFPCSYFVETGWIHKNVAGDRILLGFNLKRETQKEGIVLNTPLLTGRKCGEFLAKACVNSDNSLELASFIQKLKTLTAEVAKKSNISFRFFRDQKAESQIEVRSVNTSIFEMLFKPEQRSTVVYLRGIELPNALTSETNCLKFNLITVSGEEIVLEFLLSKAEIRELAIYFLVFTVDTSNSFEVASLIQRSF